MKLANVVFVGLVVVATFGLAFANQRCWYAMGALTDCSWVSVGSASCGFEDFDKVYVCPQVPRVRCRLAAPREFSCPCGVTGVIAWGCLMTTDNFSTTACNRRLSAELTGTETGFFVDFVSGDCGRYTVRRCANTPFSVLCNCGENYIHGRFCDEEEPGVLSVSCASEIDVKGAIWDPSC